MHHNIAPATKPADGQMKGVAEAIQILGLAKLVLDMVISMYKQVTPPRHEANLNADLHFIKAEFEIMTGHLADAAEGNGYRSNVARTWVRQVRDLTYDVEDCFQEFVVHLERPSRSPSKLKPRKKVVDEIRELKQKIEKSNKRYKDSFTGSASAAGVGHDPHKSLAITLDSFASKPNLLIGRETEKSQIIQIVTKHGRTRQIISIWGMGSIGKTVLAKSIYEDQVIIGMFQKFAWINLSHPFSEEYLVRSLIMQLQEVDMTIKETLKEMDLKDLIKESNKLLQSRSYLVVLDNVSSINQWNFLKLLFQEEGNASRIIVTTREKSVSEHCSVESIYKLEALNDDAALELFKKKVLMESAYFEGQPKIVEQAKCILDKCNGLPLAISTVGDFLATRQTAPEWEKFNDRFSSELEKNPSLERIRTVLTSNYEDLPHHLKFCFLYLSIFPKEQNLIRRRRLLRRWIAEGYASGTHNMTAEENGDDYFADLISRSIIQPSKSAAGSGVIVDYCHVHKLIHEISVSQSMKEKFSVVLGKRSSLNTHDTIRHLSISSSWTRDANELKNTGNMSQLRSLTVCGEWKTFLISEDMRMLRVLDLEGTEGVVDHHVKQVTKLVHLKYLSLRGCSDIYWLPDSLGNLWDLQTLDVRGTSIIELPATVVKLRKLQYLRAGYIPEDEQRTINWAAAMEGEDKIPEALNTTINWAAATVGLVTLLTRPQLANRTSRVDEFNFFCRYMFPILAWKRDKHGVQVPRGFGNLSRLQTLGVVDVGATKFISAELGNVSQLRKLGVTGIKRENSQQLFSTIAKLALLQSLSMRSEGEPGLQGCLDGKSSLPGNLRSLKLYGNLVILPTWISRLQNLAKLKLRSTRLEQEAIQVIGKLPHLAILRLLSNSIVGHRRVRLSFQRGDFPALVLLQLDGLPDLQSVEFQQGATSKLELLQVEGGCAGGCSGLSFLQNLKEVSLKAGHGYDDKFMEELRTQLARNPSRPALKEN